MRRLDLQRREAGFTFIEVSASLVVLVIGVLGFAGTIVYTRNLDRATRQLSRGNAAAVGALEDVRQDAAGKWASLGSLWNGHTLVATGAANAVDGTLKTSVADDPALVDSGDGMWKAGSIEPNYYHVTVTAASAQNGLAKTLDYQTYVADRTGFRSLVADPYAGPPVAGTQADSIDPLPRNVTVSGLLGDQLTFQVMNGSAAPLQLTSAYVAFTGGAGFTNVQLAGSTLYNQPLAPQAHLLLVPGTVNHQLTVNPGLAGISIRGVPLLGGLLAAILGQTIEVRMGFADGSQVQVVVNP